MGDPGVSRSSSLAQARVVCTIVAPLAASAIMANPTSANCGCSIRACFQSYREFGAMRLSDSHTTHEEGAATMQTPPLPQWSWHCLEAAWPFPQRYEHGARPPGRTVQG